MPWYKFMINYVMKSKYAGIDSVTLDCRSQLTSDVLMLSQVACSPIHLYQPVSETFCK